MSIKGYVEQISSLQVRGWAYLPEAPAEILRIEVWNNKELLATGLANLFRADLKAAGVGNGEHAFILNFPNALDKGNIPLLVIQCKSIEFGSTVLTLLNIEKNEPNLRRLPANYQSVLDPQQPLFILGSARSGTSAIAQGLLKTGFYEGSEEGHLFDLGARLIDVVRQHYRANGEELSRNTTISHVPIRYLDEGIKDQFRSIARLLFSEERWLDKTPRLAMIQSAPLLLEIWPNARFIFMKRRAIENIVSRIRKFPRVDFSDHCREWSDAMREWRQVRDRLKESQIEIEQLEMAINPVATVELVAGFLNIPSEVAVRLKELLASERPEQTADRFASVLDLDEVAWSVNDKIVFSQICGQEMEAYGYGGGKSYYSGNSPIG